MKTTPGACLDIGVVLPELKEAKKTAVRLHPRPNRVRDRGASKLGGDFLWPARDPWPICEEHHIPYVGVLQLRKKDVPDLGYRPGANLFQLLWCPRDHEPASDQGCLPRYRIVWRNTKEVGRPLRLIPKPRLREEDADEDEGHYLPKSCRLHPERIQEFPDWPELSKASQKRFRTWGLRAATEQKLQQLMAACGWYWEDTLTNSEEYVLEMVRHFYRALAVAPGTKVGGYIAWEQLPEKPPRCRCRRPMDHLLTIASSEPFRYPRWCPVEDRRRVEKLDGEELLDFCNVTGLELADDGNVHFFVCRGCKDWPAATIFQCG
jgi:hypothetical protein